MNDTSRPSDQWILDFLAAYDNTDGLYCPDCHSRLDGDKDRFNCARCGEQFYLPPNPSHQRWWHLR